MGRKTAVPIVGAAVLFFLLWLFFGARNSAVEEKDKPSSADTSSDLSTKGPNSSAGDTANSAIPDELEKSRSAVGKRFELSGKLQTESRLPLPGVDIFYFTLADARKLPFRNPPGLLLTEFAEITRKVQSNAGGGFLLSDLEAGEYLFLVWTPDFLPIFESFKLDPNAKQLELTAMGKGQTISGRVRDSGGRPLQGVTLTTVTSTIDVDFAKSSDFDLLRLQFFQEQELSQADGGFILRGLRPGDYQVYANREGYPEWMREPIPSGTADLEIVLSRGATILGKVLDQEDRPVAGAQLFTTHFFQGGEAVDGGVATSQADGSYRMEGVKAGGFGLQLAAAAEGHALYQEKLSPLEEGAVKEHEVRLKKGEACSGRVVDDQGKPLPNALLRVAPGKFSLYFPVHGHSSDEQGRFRIASLVEGESYRLYASCPGYSSREFFPIRAGNSNLTLTLESQRSAAFQLVDEGGSKKFPEFRVEIFAEDEHGQKSSVFAQAFPAGSGAFRLERVSSVQNGIAVWVTGYAPFYSTGLKGLMGGGEGGSAIPIPLLRGRTVRGRIVDATTKSPIEGARIDLVLESRKGVLRRSGSMATNTDGYGRFQIEGAAHGISISKENYHLLNRRISHTEEGSVVDLGEISLSSGGSLRITVFDPADRPIPGMGISIRNAQQEWEESGFTSGDGTLSLDHLEPGDLAVSAWNWLSTLQDGRPYAQSRWVTISEGKTTDLTLRLAQGGTVHGFVRWGNLPDPLRVPRAHVQMSLAESLADGSAKRNAYWGQPDPTGEFWIFGVPEGDYIGTVRSFLLPERHEACPQQIRVVAGQETRVDFFVEAGGISGRVIEMASGNPLEGVRLELLSEGKGASGVLYSREGGDFGVVGLSEGSYRLRARKDKFAVDEFGPFSVAKDRKTEALVLELIPQGLLEVVVQSKSGNALSGAQVFLNGQNRDLFSGANGGVLFSQLKPGLYEVNIQAPGYAKKTAGPATVEVGKTKSLYVYLRKLCKLKVEVKGPGGSAAPEGTILTLLDQETGQPWPTPVKVQGGLATILDLPEGAWKIQIAGSSFGDIEVLPDQDNAVQVELK